MQWRTLFALSVNWVALAAAAPASEQLFAVGDYRNAAIQLEAQSRSAEREGRCDLALAVVLNNLGAAYYELGRYRDAQRAYEQSIHIRRLLAEDSTRDAARTLSNLGSIYLKLKLTTQAEQTLLRAVSILESTDAASLTTASGWLNLAAAYTSERRWEEAEELIRKALHARERTLGAEHRDVAMALNNLGQLLHERGRDSEAQPLLERAVGTWEQALGPDHPQVSIGLHNLAVVHMSLGARRPAEECFQRAIDIAMRSLPPDHPHLAAYRSGYAALLRKLDRKKEARRMEELARGAHQRSDADNLLGFTVDARQLLR